MKSYTLETGKTMLKEVFNLEMDDFLVIFQSIRDSISVSVFDNHDHIVRDRDTISQLHLLIHGTAKISVTHEDGGSSIIYFLKPNELIGELTLLGIEQHPKDVIAIGTCVCLSIPMAIAERSLLEDPQFLLAVSRYIGTKLLDRTWFNVKQQHYSLKPRLAAHILLCASNGLYNEKHTQTAEYLGVSYRHLLHTFQNFRESGLITKEKKGYSLNRQGLESLANQLK
jgi:CRP-like cAMP-binding protein